MLKRSDLHDYQVKAVDHLMEWPDTMLWMGMGLGKTICTLTAIAERIARGEIRKVLIFGPVRVITSVWTKEARKWEHTQHLRFSVIHGTPTKRLRALFAEADIHLCNYENMSWLAEQFDKYYFQQGKPLPYDMCVYDEVSKVKNATSMRMKGGYRDVEDSDPIKIHGWVPMIPHFRFHVGLTGTPASNGYIDLHGQFLAVDNGKRLGKGITHYRDSYFASDYNGWGYKVTDIGKTFIESRISDITLKMDTREYLDLPPVKDVNMMVDLPPKARRIYDEIEADMFSQLDSGEELEVFNKASVSNKCLQICNGAVYLKPDEDEEPRLEFEKIHSAKLDALEEVLEEAAGQPVLCAYNFISDAKRIMERFKKYRPVNLTAMAANKTQSVIDKWNNGGIKLLIGHPASIGHGIDGLQESGSIVVWFGMNWSLELYDQLNKRIDRQGQTQPVRIIRILCNDTVDLAVADAIERKTDDEEGLKAAIDRYRSGITTNELEVNFF